ncbi:hypothetical protein [Bergeriella denitrificans]|uniref:Uncharacterized protein n=1 Tax=Bergeriella denitrificans TaxID=494 RepID=A0A378UIG1_BERDE|nr:hypothetical protein [Bergeriella denitrificans]STZ77126.1 Uncharacterised protein [Bergeriella denitrificans]
MAAKPYQARIAAYCQAQGIDIPAGFYRHAASRYAAVNYSCTPPKLLAVTWFKLEDARYYLNKFSDGRVLRIFDFKDGCHLIFEHNIDGNLLSANDFNAV